MVAAGFAVGAKKGAEKTPETKTTGTKATELKTELHKVSYILGANVGRSFKQGRLKTIEYDAFVQGMKDVFAKKDLAFTPKQMQAIMTAFGKKKKEELDNIGKTNTTEGKAFLAENAKKKGVITLKSGLQYKIIKNGTGAIPKATDTVEAVYKGTLIDGTVFDASSLHKGPSIFGVGGVIKGWTEALQLMPVGSKWILYIPGHGNLAYGSNGNGDDIGPNATLIFEIELVKIMPPKIDLPNFR
ncbi:MAG: FKBP-type peptidyl-prolyl cis-trans isomerase [Planctomycetes bacterium]|nr:FKBP-type peptidyl-prolyl cis-trans isomerase [Planctomycetota bacterium]